MKTIYDLLSNAYLAVTNWERFRYWQAKKSGQKFCDYQRGCGYYLPFGFFSDNPIGQIWEVEMRSGKVGIYELIDYKCCSDPEDMVKESRWDFKGYKDHKPIASCTFKEYMDIYAIKNNRP